MYTSLSSNQANFNKTIIFSLVVHFILLSILFYSSERPRRLSLPPIYTVDILAPTPDIKKRPAVKKQRTPAKKTRSKAVTKKPVSKPSVKREKNIVTKREVNEKVIKEPLKKTVKAASPLKKTVKAAPPPKKSGKAKIQESANLQTDETKLEKAFIGLKKTDITQTQNIKRGIAQLEAKLKLRQRELKIKSALKKFKKSTNLEDEIKDSSSITKQPLQKLDRESHTSRTIQEDIDTFSREKNLRVRGREETIREAFRRLKEKEETISQDIKELVKKTEESNIPAYEPREWNFELKGEKGLSAKFRMGEISDEEAISIAKIIAERIKSAWKVDEFLTMQQNYSTLKSVVSIKVGQNGKIVAIVVEKKSENPIFHKSVLAAIKESDPLPLEDLNIRGGFEIGLTFSPINTN